MNKQKTLSDRNPRYSKWQTYKNTIPFSFNKGTMILFRDKITSCPQASLLFLPLRNCQFPKPLSLNLRPHVKFIFFTFKSLNLLKKKMKQYKTNSHVLLTTAFLSSSKTTSESLHSQSLFLHLPLSTQTLWFDILTHPPHI